MGREDAIFFTVHLTNTWHRVSTFFSNAVIICLLRNHNIQHFALFLSLPLLHVRSTVTYGWFSYFIFVPRNSAASSVSLNIFGFCAGRTKEQFENICLGFNKLWWTFLIISWHFIDQIIHHLIKKVSHLQIN